MQVAQDSEALRPGEVADEGEDSGGVVGVKARHGLVRCLFSSGREQTPPEAVRVLMGQSAHDRPVVLLVEDEPLVRMFGADVLEEAGFEVLEAVDGDAALAVLETRPDIAVLFTDVKMPGSLDGLGLARLVHARRPDIKLLIASGHVRLDAGEIPDQGRFLPKPYGADAIVREIRDLVA